MMNMKNLIELKGLTKYYQNQGQIAEGIRKIDLKFNLNEFVAITGESGSGKTTLLNVISGLDSYEDGEFYINGIESSHYQMKDWEDYRSKYVGFVFQNYNIIDSYTVYQNIAIALEAQDFDPKLKHERVLELIEEVGLTKYKNKKTAKLSGGEKQRVVIARAIAKNSPIILADEPTGNLDSTSGKNIMDLLKKVSNDRLVIVVTHNVLEIEPYLTRKVILEDGSIKEDITVVKTELKTLDDIKDSSTSTKIENAKKVGLIAGRNILATPNRTIFQASLFLIITLFTLLIFSLFIVTNKTITPRGPNDNNIYIANRFNKEITKDDILFFESQRSKKIKVVPNLDYRDYNDDENKANITTPTGKSSYARYNDAGLLFEKEIIGRLPQENNEVVIDGNNGYLRRANLDLYDVFYIMGNPYIIVGKTLFNYDYSTTIYFKSSHLYNENYEPTITLKKYTNNYSNTLESFNLHGINESSIKSLRNKLAKDKDITKKYIIDSYEIYGSKDERSTKVLFTVSLVSAIGIILFVLGKLMLIIMKNIMNGRLKEFAVYRSVGISKKELKYVILLEQVLIAIIAIIVSIILVLITSNLTISFRRVFLYYKLWHYLLVGILIALYSLWLGNKYNNKVFSKTVIESLKEEL